MHRARLNRMLAALACVAGCGRLNFDGSGGRGDARDDGSGRTDASDDASVDSAPAVEVCNGVDDTSDGLIDEGCPCTPFDINPTFPQNAAITFTGSELLLYTGAQIERIDGGGLVGSPILGVMSGLGWQSMARSGQTVGITYRAGANQYYFQTLDPTTSGFGPATQVDVDAAGGAPSIVWNGSKFAIAWPSGSNITLFEISADGATIGPKITISLSTTMPNMQMLVTPTGYAFVDTVAPGLVYADRPTLVERRYVPDLSGAGGPFMGGVGPNGVLVMGNTTVGTNRMLIVRFDGTTVASAAPIPTGPSGESLEHANVAGTRTGYWVTGQYTLGGVLQFESVDVDTNQVASNPQAFASFPLNGRGTIFGLVVTETRRLATLYYDDPSFVNHVMIHQQCP